MVKSCVSIIELSLILFGLSLVEVGGIPSVDGICVVTREQTCAHAVLSRKPNSYGGQARRGKHTRYPSSPEISLYIDRKSVAK